MHFLLMMLLGVVVAHEGYRTAVKREKKKRIEEAFDLGLDEPGD
jgi:hypothetical protein